MYTLVADVSTLREVGGSGAVPYDPKGFTTEGRRDTAVSTRTPVNRVLEGSWNTVMRLHHPKQHAIGVLYSVPVTHT